EKPAEAAKPAEQKQPEGPKPVTRESARQESNSALREQQLSVDDKRMVSFNFVEAPWTFVIEELARVSGLNLDWQQLPGDTLNLRSNTKYTAPQARDLVNQNLLARGYS